MIKNTISKAILLVVYVIAIVLQMIYFVPCEKLYLVLSDNNTSHATVTGNSYNSIFEIEKSFKPKEDNGRHAYCETIDTPQLAINLSFTTIVAIATYFLFIFKKDNDYKNTKKQEFIEPPYLNFDELAFADEETQIKVQKEYAEAMYRYVASKINK